MWAPAGCRARNKVTAMKTLCLAVALLGMTVLSPVRAAAQFAEPNPAGVTLAQIHLIVSDLDAHKRFWTTIMGGEFVERGAFTFVVFRDVLVFLEKGQAVGPTSASVLDHFGFGYRDIDAQLVRWKELGADVRPGPSGKQGYVWGPDEVRVEYASDPTLPVAFRMDHLHMQVPDIPQIQAWYADHFGGVTGQRQRNASPGLVECSYFGRSTISFNPIGNRPPRQPSKGRVIDRFGFEVPDLQAFVAKLRAGGVAIDAGPHLIPGTQIWAATVTDPVGDTIEITQNLASMVR